MAKINTYIYKWTAAQCAGAHYVYTYEWRYSSIINIKRKLKYNIFT